MVFLEEGEKLNVESMDGRISGEGESTEEGITGASVGGGAGDKPPLYFTTSYDPSNPISANDTIQNTTTCTAVAAGGHTATAVKPNNATHFGYGNSISPYGCGSRIGSTLTAEKAIRVQEGPRVGNTRSADWHEPSWQHEKLKGKGKLFFLFFIYVFFK